MLVPCGGCTLCCRDTDISLLHADDSASFSMMDSGGQQVIERTPDGACVYLGGTGCTIHDRKPMMCRAMDCRPLAHVLTADQALALEPDRLCRLDVWRRGHSMLTEMTDNEIQERVTDMTNFAELVAAERRIDEAFARHERVVLQFSGGKDSLACLYLIRPHWHKVTVAWCNRGAEFPETEAVIERIKQLPLGGFVEVRPPVPQPLSIQQHGLPVDVLPLGNTIFYGYATGKERTGVLVQEYLACCNRLLFQPLANFVREYGATLVIRGQRSSEEMVGPIRDGAVEGGVEYLLPLETWGRGSVIAYLKQQGVELPPSYQHVRKSLDCWGCTAFLGESQLSYLKEFHPDKWKVVADRLLKIKRALQPDMDNLEAAISLIERG